MEKCDKIKDIIQNEFYDIIYKGKDERVEYVDVRSNFNVAAGNIVPNHELLGIILMND